MHECYASINTPYFVLIFLYKTLSGNASILVVNTGIKKNSIQSDIQKSKKLKASQGHRRYINSHNYSFYHFSPTLHNTYQNVVGIPILV